MLDVNRKICLEDYSLVSQVLSSDDIQTVIPGDRFFYLQGNSHDKILFFAYSDLKK